MSPKPAGYSGTPLARKLGLKRGMTVRLLGAPVRYWDLFGPEVGDLDLVSLEPEDEASASFTHLFATTLQVLRDDFDRARAGMTQDGMVWASWPKKSSGVETEVGRSAVMREGKAAGLVDVKVCAVDETWSGLKFVIPVAERKDESPGRA